MLKSLRLVNFQAHIDSFIELDEGITSLTGESHEGKTAIMRGLNWAVNNEPAGTGFISYWAKHQTKKGMTVIDRSCKVECIREDGSILIRERSLSFNGYRINGKDLARAGVGVPDEVKKWFNMGEVNIQNQHDSLFLLHSGGKGGQEVARFLNSVVKLDEIPRALTAVESKKRSIKKLREAETEKITSCERDIKSLGWILKAEPVFKRLEKVEKDIEDLEDKENTIIEEIDKYNGLKDVLELFKWTKNTSPLVERWLSLYNKEAHILDNQKSINISLTSFYKNQSILVVHQDWLPEAEKAISKIKEIENDIGFSTLHIQNIEQQIIKHDTAILFLENNQPWLENTADKIMQLEMLDDTIGELENKELNISNEITLFERHEASLKEWSTMLQKDEKRLPAICPLCKSSWKGDKHENSR